jgi:hypothetical protein
MSLSLCYCYYRAREHRNTFYLFTTKTIRLGEESVLDIESAPCSYRQLLFLIVFVSVFGLPRNYFLDSFLAEHRHKPICGMGVS